MLVHDVTSCLLITILKPIASTFIKQHCTMISLMICIFLLTTPVMDNGQQKS